jgi:hypothetical protein
MKLSQQHHYKPPSKITSGLQKSFSKSNASRKETMHKRYRRPIEDLGFSLYKMSKFLKQCLLATYNQRPSVCTLET